MYISSAFCLQLLRYLFCTELGRQRDSTASYSPVTTAVLIRPRQKTRTVFSIFLSAHKHSGLGHFFRATLHLYRVAVS
ncbi:hypothetical protein B0T20DRAFT_35376 [Sordaria brevicollis]|uniref:Secreted protein n=1 Tax=Sordaria brevicollis TaxID=83679 RepID=A0AAE0U9F0_SORBR|nr:hypothetical protein B0T20DRAFT_35376 [Sordaria brevicollis]